MTGHPSPAPGEVAGQPVDRAAGQPDAFAGTPTGGARLRPAGLLIVCGILLAAAVAVGAGLVLSNRAIRRYVGELSPGQLLETAMPDVQRYMKLRAM